jgi:RNA polymerase sigma factor (sigma-70 family)
MGARESQEAIIAIKSLQAGDQAAFPLLMKILNNAVYYTVWRFTQGNKRYVDDFVQEAWIAVYRAAQSYDTVTYPYLLTSYFTKAITNQVVGTGLKTTAMLVPPRGVARFHHDVATGNVDWSQSNEEISRSYPRVRIAEIERARSSSDYRCTYVDNFDRVYETHADVVAFEDWLTTALDIEQILQEVKAQLNPLQYRIFELRFLKELSRPEVAQLLKISVTTVHQLERQLLTTRFVVREPFGSGRPETLGTFLRQALALSA